MTNLGPLPACHLPPPPQRAGWIWTLDVDGGVCEGVHFEQVEISPRALPFALCKWLPLLPVQEASQPYKLHNPVEKRVVPVRSQLIWRPPSTGRWYLSAPLVCLVSYCYCPDFPDWIAWARTTGHLPHSFSLILLLKKFLLKGWFLNVHNVSQSLWAERDLWSA